MPDDGQIVGRIYPGYGLGPLTLKLMPDGTVHAFFSDGTDVAETYGIELFPPAQSVEPRAFSDPTVRKLRIRKEKP